MNPANNKTLNFQTCAHRIYSITISQSAYSPTTTSSSNIHTTIVHKNYANGMKCKWATTTTSITKKTEEEGVREHIC